MSILAKLEEQAQFTETEQSIAAYLLKNKEELQSLTISDITQATYTSNASIMRLCKKLGVQGFRELRLQMIREVERRRSEAKPVNVNYPFVQTDSVDDITGAVADLMLETVQSMKELSLSAQLAQLARSIKASRHVYYYAKGDTLLSLKGFANRLTKLGIEALQADENKEMEARMQLMKEGDVFFCISYSGRNLPTVQELNTLEDKQVKRVLVTAASEVKGFDLVIALPHREHDYNEKISTFYSQTAIFYLLNCVYSILYAMHRRGQA